MNIQGLMSPAVPKENILTGGGANSMARLLSHDGGRARNSDEFICLHSILFKKHVFRVRAKKRVSKHIHMFLIFKVEILTNLN